MTRSQPCEVVGTECSPCQYMYLLRTKPWVSSLTPSPCIPVSSISRAFQIGQLLHALIATALVQAASLSHLDCCDDLPTGLCLHVSTYCLLSVSQITSLPRSYPSKPSPYIEGLCEPCPQNLTDGASSPTSVPYCPRAPPTLPSRLLPKWTRCVPTRALYTLVSYCWETCPLYFCCLLHWFLQVLFKYYPEAFPTPYWKW